jgi:O-antigen/teichoic acid export membrane protein
MRVSGLAAFAAKLIRSAWGSMALRAAAALGLGGVALAAGNLILARVLAPAEFAQFALLYAIVQLGINIGPIGVDVALTRRLITPNVGLRQQAFFTSFGVAVVLVIMSAVLYPLSIGLLATILISVTGGGLEVAALAYYRSRERVGFSLVLSSCANASLLLAAFLAMGLKVTSAILPAVALSVAFTSTALVAWQRIKADRRDWKEPAAAPFPWAVGWAAVSFTGAGIILTSLDRLVIPRFLGMSDLATFTVLATVAGSPFSMLYQAVSYTLVARLRNAANTRQRVRVLGRESAVVVMTCLVAGTAVLWLMPLVLKWVLADRYAIGRPLLIAAICVGFLKVIASLAAAAVNALGSRAEFVKMSYIGWAAIGIAVLGAAVGARWGLIGLVYGIGCGWLMRGAAVAYIAAPLLYSVDDTAADAEPVAARASQHTN